MLKRNIVSDFKNIDDRAESAYDSVGNKDWITLSFDLARIIYLYLLQDLTADLDVESKNIKL